MAESREISHLGEGAMESEAREEDAYIARLTDFAFGTEPGKLNLKAVLTKASEMYASLCRLEQDLRFDVENKRWHQLIDLFSIIHLQYNALIKQLRSNLGFWAVFPRRVEQGLAIKLQGGMISPKLLVEQEQENDAVVAASEARDLRDIQETVDHIRGVIERITRHNHQAPDSGVLDSRSPPLAALLTEMRRDRKARATQQHGGKGANRAAPKLGQMIQFLSKPPA